jgi:hypothetical protein
MFGIPKKYKHEVGVGVAILGLVAGSKNPNGRPYSHTTKKKTANGHLAGWPDGRNIGRMAVWP